MSDTTEKAPKVKKEKVAKAPKAPRVKKEKKAKVAKEDRLKLAQVNEVVVAAGGTVTKEVAKNKESKNWSTESTLNDKTFTFTKAYGVLNASINGDEATRFETVEELNTLLQ